MLSGQIGSTSLWWAPTALMTLGSSPSFRDEFHAHLGVVLVAVRLDALSDVVQEGAALGDVPVDADLGGEHAGDDGDFLGMREDILSIAGPEMQPPEGLDEFRRHVVQSQIEDDLLAFLEYLLGDLARHFLDDFLDAGGMDAPVRDEALEGHPRDLAPHRIETGDDHSLGRVVYDDVDAGESLEGPDVASLAADDPAPSSRPREGSRR